MKTLNNYRKKIRKIIISIAQDVIKDLEIPFFKRFLYKKKFKSLFYKNKTLIYLTTYFYMFDKELNKNNEKIIKIILRYFIIFYFSNFILPKLKKNKKYLKNTLNLFQKKYKPEIENFFISNNLKIERKIPNFEQKTYVNWKKFIKEEIFVYASFFRLFIKKIEGLYYDEKKLELGYKLGFSLGMNTFSSIERKKYEFLFLKRFNPINKNKTDLFFIKLYFWSQMVLILRLFLPYKYNSFVVVLNQQIGS